MNKVTRHLTRLDVGARLAAISFVLIALVFGIFVWTIGYATSNLLEQRAADQIVNDPLHSAVPTQRVLNVWITRVPPASPNTAGL